MKLLPSFQAYSSACPWLNANGTYTCNDTAMASFTKQNANIYIPSTLDNTTFNCHDSWLPPAHSRVLFFGTSYLGQVAKAMLCNLEPSRILSVVDTARFLCELCTADEASKLAYAASYPFRARSTLQGHSVRCDGGATVERPHVHYCSADRSSHVLSNGAQIRLVINSSPEQYFEAHDDAMVNLRAVSASWANFSHVVYQKPHDASRLFTRLCNVSKGSAVDGSMPTKPGNCWSIDGRPLSAMTPKSRASLPPRLVETVLRSRYGFTGLFIEVLSFEVNHKNEISCKLPLCVAPTSLLASRQMCAVPDCSAGPGTRGFHQCVQGVPRLLACYLMWLIRWYRK
mmetsp:Transcript_30812/g.50970  ORF Transcript_30812/g.50970 Transcript_30812/m.50970 type:complete len:342 (-) Transcript_30812:380-1405(-)